MDNDKSVKNYDIIDQKQPDESLTTKNANAPVNSAASMAQVVPNSSF